MISDIRYGARALLRTPGFTIVALLSLALGIGANAAIFTLVNALILKSLPVSQPQSLVTLRIVDDRGGKQYFSYPVYKTLQEQQQAFSGLIAWTEPLWPMEVNGELRATPILQVSGNYFDTLGIRPFIGRTIVLDDDRISNADSSTLAMVSYTFWESRLGRNPNALGRTIFASGVPFTIIGVCPPEFSGLRVGDPFDVAIPLASLPLITHSRAGLESRDAFFLLVLGRLKAGVTIDRARANLSQVWPHVLAENIPVGRRAEQARQFLSLKLQLEPAASGLSTLRERFSRPLLVLMFLVGLVLLIACVNIANLLLARAVVRRKEFGIRVALGASRARLISQLMSESLLLSIGGAILGFAFSLLATRLLVRFVADSNEYFILNTAPDFLVLLFTAAVAILTALFFGLAPAFTSTSAGPADALGSSGRSFTRSRFGLGLVAAQVAFSIILLVGAGLFTESLRNLRTLDPGFRAQGVLVLQLQNRPGGYAAPGLDAYHKTLLRRVNALGGVLSAALGKTLPLADYEPTEESIFTPRGEVRVVSSAISPRFFETIGTALLRGREFGPQDTEVAPRVAVVSESLAARLFPGENAVGKSVSLGTAPEHQSLQIIGVVHDAQYATLRKKAPLALYLCLFQENTAATRYPTLLVHTSGNPSDLIAPISGELKTLGREYPSSTSTLVQRMDRSMWTDRLVAILSGLFGVLGLLLACVGLYGLMAYIVARRTAEIGIRMAMGAQPESILWQVLRDTLVLVAIGIAVGLPIALASARLVSSVLFGLSPADPLAIAAAVLAMLLAGLAAGYIPARRASHVNPVNALRHE